MRLKYKKQLEDVLCRYRDEVNGINKKFPVFEDLTADEEENKVLIFTVFRYLFNRVYGFKSNEYISFIPTNDDMKKAFLLVKQETTENVNHLTTVGFPKSTKGLSQTEKHAITIHNEILKNDKKLLLALDYFISMAEEGKLEEKQ